MKRQDIYFSVVYVILLVWLLASASCTLKRKDQQDEMVDSTTITAQSQETEDWYHPADWSYHGENPPEQWAEINDAYRDCGGEIQSPIDIIGSIPIMELKALQINYSPSPLHIINNGHTIQANYDEGSTMIFSHRKYPFIQFHFHCPSEHLIKGQRFPMEIHLVHVDSESEIAVIAVMVEEGSESPFFTALCDSLPEKGRSIRREDITINAGDLFSGISTRYYTYIGSLTTPPCTEGVNWIVMMEPAQASSQQIEKIKNLMPDNNARPVQPLNQRPIKSYNAY